MKNKSILLFSTLLLSCTALVGCGNGSDTTTSTKTSGTTSTSVAQVFTIKFMNGDEIYKTYQLNEGEQITAPETNPTKPSSGGYNYKFEGWSEDKEIVNLDFPKASENKTYYALYESQVITYTATVHFNYAGGPEDKTFSYTVKDNLSTKANEVKALLPEPSTEATYVWDSPIPNSLPLENKTYTINKLENYFTVDMTSDKVDPHFQFIKRSAQETETGMKMVNNAIQITSSNDYLLVSNKYSSFDLNFKMKITNSDRFNLVIGTNEENIKLSHPADNDDNAVGGIVGVTLVPSHSTKLVRLNSEKGPEQLNPLHIDTNVGFNKGDGVNVRVRMIDYKCEVFFNNFVVNAFTLTSEKYTPGNQIGFAFSGDNVITISEFSIASFENTSFTHDMSTLGRASEQLVPYGDGATTSYNDSTKALEFTALGHRKIASFHKISSNFKLSVDIKYSGTNSDRVDLLFGMQESDLSTTFSGGQNNNHTTHPGLMNALIVPNHATKSVRLFYNGIPENQFDTKAAKVDISTNIVNLEVSCYNGLFTFKINNQENNTYQLPDQDFPTRGYFGICSGNGSGTISITKISVVDCYVPE